MCTSLLTDHDQYSPPPCLIDRRRLTPLPHLLGIPKCRTFQVNAGSEIPALIGPQGSIYNSIH